MDRLSAHLDRAWELLAESDWRGARACAKRALDLDADSPEAHNVLGQAAAGEGEVDEALEHYRTAISLDDGYPDPMLNAAELLIHPLGDFEGAIDLCDEVLEFVDTREEIVDAMLLKVDALLGRGDEEAAKAALDALPEGPYEQPGQAYLVGRALFETGQAERAEPLLVQAIDGDPENPDGHYYLGMVRDQRQDWRGATMAFLECRDLDAAMPPPAWSLPRDQFQKTVVRALGTLDPALALPLEGALVLGDAQPGIEVVADGVDPRVPVLIEGLGDAPEGAPERVVRVFVYQRNLERLCGGIEDLEDEIAHQVTEELLHLTGATAPPRPAAQVQRLGAARAQPDEAREKPPEAAADEGSAKKKPRKPRN